MMVRTISDVKSASPRRMCRMNWLVVQDSTLSQTGGMNANTSLLIADSNSVAYHFFIRLQRFGIALINTILVVGETAIFTAVYMDM